MFCKKCGKEIDGDSKFCNFCGAEQDISVSEIQKTDISGNLEAKAEETPKKNSDKILLGIFVGIVIFFIIVALIVMGNNKANDDKKSIEIPENNITYVRLSIGNVIQDGKQAIFFKFASDYTVTKIEIAGTL